jgi:hypothetical protein
MLRFEDVPVVLRWAGFGRAAERASRRLTRPLAESCCQARQFLGNEARGLGENDGPQLV